jgi:hypothetical protein
VERMTKLRLKDDVAWREAAGEVIALDSDKRNYVSANPAGTLLWRALDEGATRKELVERLTAEFGLDAEQSAHDVDAFVADLRANGLLAG